MATVMPLVREFNQACQVFADNINLRYGYELEPQTLMPEEVESWDQTTQHAHCRGNSGHQPYTSN